VTPVELFLDLLPRDSWRDVYAGELEVRPPGAPTTELDVGIVLLVMPYELSSYVRDPTPSLAGQVR
jgi:hypothetical protein